MTLRISDDLRLKDEAMLMSMLVLGMPETGKTTFAKVVCEEVWKIKQRFGAIDPKGDYYGLKSSADGQSGAIPLVVFGGEHADVPLEANAGRFIANVVSRELTQPFVIDVEKFSKGKQITFVADFLEELYHINRDPLLLVIDELQRFAPEKAQFPEHHRCLGAVEDVFKLGRKHGLGRIGITQRGAEANKSVTDTCDLLAAFRASGVLDQKRVRMWLEANVGQREITEAMATIASLDKGVAIISSARKEIKTFGVVHVRALETFDTSATPGLKRRRKEPKVLAKPDLIALESKMRDQIEKQKENDPKALRAYVEDQKRMLRKQTEAISQLQAQLASAKAPREKVVRKEVKVPVLDEKLLMKFAREVGESYAEALNIAGTNVVARAHDIAKNWEPPPIQPSPTKPISATMIEAARQLKWQTIAEPTASTRRIPYTRTVAQADPNGEIKHGMQKIIDVLAWAKRSLPTPELDKVRLAHMADQSPRSGGYFANLAALKRLGFIESLTPATFVVTENGWSHAHEEDVTGTSLREQVYAKLKPSERSMVEFLLKHDVVTKAELAEATGQSVRSGGYFANLARLKALKLIESPSPAIFRAADFLREP